MQEAIRRVTKEKDLRFLVSPFKLMVLSTGIEPARG